MSAKKCLDLNCALPPDHEGACKMRFCEHGISYEGRCDYCRRPATKRLAEDHSPVPHDAQERKQRPICRGVLDYFPDAITAVANVSYVGNQQHNPGEPMHWAKDKSTDEADALVRHLLDRGKRDTDGLRHSAKVAWRALALLQREIDAEKEQAK